MGIGASAGGLEALEQFFRNMPPESGLAFVIVQHLSPDYKSLMVELLSRHTEMKVLRTEDGMAVKPNHVYLIPPKSNLTIFHQKLYLTEQDSKHGLNLPINIFFRSLAEDMGERAIGVVMSGTGSDATLGLRAIKGSGGLVISQSLESSKFDGMPRSAISTGIMDFVLSPEKMPEAILNYVKHPFIHNGLSVRNALTTERDALSKVLAIIRSKKGVDFTFYKPNTLVRRIERRVSINQINTIEDYIAYLQSSDQEASVLYKELLIGVTKFFRDGEAFQILKEKVIPDLMKSKSHTKQVRIWSAGCSTGEEAYTLAMLFREYMELNSLQYDLKVFATDIDQDAIEYASLGFYPESIVADVPARYLTKYFNKTDDGYSVNEMIRRMVVFATHNTIKDPPFSKMDLVACRNLLIYLQPLMQQKVIKGFNFSLNVGGVLFLGSSESVGEISESYTNISSKWRLFKYQGGHKAVLASDFISTLPPYSPKRKGLYSPQKDENPIQTAFEHIVNSYVPPSFLVSGEYELLHVFGDVSRFMKLPVGKISLNVQKMASPELSAALSTAMHRAFKEGTDVSYNDIRFGDKDSPSLVNITVKPLNGDQGKPAHAVVIFDEHSKGRTHEEIIELSEANDSKETRLHDLEHELNLTKENLQATIEEMETSNEELQSTNEELIASNEELQSTNEELQSVNEELYTVNTEYQQKIEELTQLNNDMDNLLRNTEIGMVFLDMNLNVRKFTPVTTQVMNILDVDRGRPFSHISHRLEYEGLASDIQHTLRTLEQREVEVSSKEGRHYLMRILPYRTTENAVDGIVITFTDMTERKRFEQALMQNENQLRLITNSLPSAISYLDADRRHVFSNKAYREWFDKDKKDIEGKTVRSVLGAQIYNRMRDRIDEVLGGTPVNFEIELPADNGDMRLLDVSCIPDKREKDRIEGFFFLAHDITQRVYAERELQKRYQKLKEARKIASLAQWELDLVQNRLTWSDEVYEMFGVDRDTFKVSFESFISLVHSEDREPLNQAYQDSLKNGSRYDFVHRIIRPDGEELTVREVCTTEFDQKGNPLRSLGTVQDITYLARQESLLRRREDDYCSLVENLHEGIWRLDKDAKTTFVNNSLTSMLGYTEKEMMGKHLCDFMDDECRKVLQQSEGVKRGGISGEHELQLRTKQGSVIYVSFLSTLLFDEHGNPYGSLASVLDITDRKVAQKRLQKERETLRIMLEHSPVAKVMLDAEGNIMYANKAAADTLGLEVSEIVRQHYDSSQWTMLNHEGEKLNDKDIPFNVIKNMMEPLVNYPVKLKKPDDRIVPMLVNGVPVKDEGGRLEYIVFSLVEIPGEN